MPHQVLIRPLVTEKGIHRAQRYNHYAFEVAPDATKIDVRKAVEEHFNVKVEKVAIQNRKGKSLGRDPKMEKGCCEVERRLQDRLLLVDDTRN